MKTDISTTNDIKNLVDSFYEKVRKDRLLKDIFNTVIHDRWPEHLEKMYRFWQTVLLDQHTYSGSPFLPHANLPIQPEHFKVWLKLFNATVDEHYTGKNALKIKWQAARMAEMFLNKIEIYRNTQKKPLL